MQWPVLFGDFLDGMRRRQNAAAKRLRTWVDESESPVPKKARRGDAAGGRAGAKSGAGAGGEQEESKECVVCMVSKKEYIFVPWLVTYTHHTFSFSFSLSPALSLSLARALSLLQAPCPLFYLTLSLYVPHRPNNVLKAVYDISIVKGVYDMSMVKGVYDISIHDISMVKGVYDIIIHALTGYPGA